MSLFRVYVDGALFYHPQMSRLAITDVRIEEDAENIDSMLPAQMAILLPGWIKPKKNLALIFKPFNHETIKALCELQSAVFYSGKIRGYEV